MSTQKEIENLENSNVIESIERAKYVIHEAFDLHQWNVMSASPVFATLVQYFINRTSLSTSQKVPEVLHG